LYIVLITAIPTWLEQVRDLLLDRFFELRVEVGEPTELLEIGGNWIPQRRRQDLPEKKHRRCIGHVNIRRPAGQAF